MKAACGAGGERGAACAWREAGQAAEPSFDDDEREELEDPAVELDDVPEDELDESDELELLDELEESEPPPAGTDAEDPLRESVR